MRGRRLFKMARVARVCDIGDPFPAVQTAIIFSDGETLEITFDKKIADSGSGSGDEGFALTGLSGGATTLARVSVIGRVIQFTINRTVAGAETGGVLAYTPGVVATSPAGRLLKAFSGKVVVNESLE